MAESEQSEYAEESEQPQQPEQSEQPEQSRLSSTNIEHLQEVKAREGNQAATEQGLRELLSVLDPHPQDHALAYHEVLGRLQNVIARELQQQGG